MQLCLNFCPACEDLSSVQCRLERVKTLMKRKPLGGQFSRGRLAGSCRWKRAILGVEWDMTVGTSFTSSSVDLFVGYQLPEHLLLWYWVSISESQSGCNCQKLLQHLCSASILPAFPLESCTEPTFPHPPSLNLQVLVPLPGSPVWPAQHCDGVWAVAHVFPRYKYKYVHGCKSSVHSTLVITRPQRETPLVTRHEHGSATLGRMASYVQLVEVLLLLAARLLYSMEGEYDTKFGAVAHQEMSVYARR